MLVVNTTVKLLKYYLKFDIMFLSCKSYLSTYGEIVNDLISFLVEEVMFN